LSISNHNPKPLSEKVTARLAAGGYETYLKKHPMGELDKPGYSVTAHYHKGAPDGLVNIGDKERRDYMEFNVTPQLPANGLTVLELFCGGGLGAVGFKAAGYDIVKALDFDKNAVAAYRHNFGDHVEQADINSVDIGSLPNTDVIFGGPPCQDFSVAGKGDGEEGERGKLVWRYLEIIQAKQPKAFVFENVKGLLTKKHRGTFDALLTKFSEIGYEISWQLVMAWDYGVAQKRERVFIVGVRQDLGIKFEFPQPMEGDYRTQVLRDVIGDLPESNDGTNAHIQTQATTVKKLDGIYNQRAYKADWEKPAKTVCTNRLDHAEIHPGNHSRKDYGTPKSEYTYVQANRVQSMDKPCNTIPAHHNSGQPIHPTEAPRRFTVRECLRIQSVPDTYVLPEELSLSAMYRVVGNGIASRVAWYIGKALAEQLLG
jgi:DNA (cytosine-5)-methyltransferase 1